MTRLALIVAALAGAGCNHQGPDPQAPPRAHAQLFLPGGPVAPIAVDPRAPEAAAGAEGVRSLPCSVQRGLRSIESTTSIELEFVNAAEEPVQILWLDFAGERLRYNVLAPGESYRQQTYVTHPWLVVGRASCYGVYLPVAAGNERVVIGAN